MGRRTRNLTLTIAVISVTVAWPAAANAKQVCWPGVNVPPVEIPATTIPAKEIPARKITIPTIPGWVATTTPTITIPAITIPAVSIPAFTIPGYTVPERCFDSEKTDALPPSKTSVRVRNYHRIDSSFSLALSIAYWRQTGPEQPGPRPQRRGLRQVDSGRARQEPVRARLHPNRRHARARSLAQSDERRPAHVQVHPLQGPGTRLSYPPIRPQLDHVGEGVGTPRRARVRARERKWWAFGTRSAPRPAPRPSRRARGWVPPARPCLARARDRDRRSRRPVG